MFFANLPDAKTKSLSQVLGENAFSSALTLMSLYRYEAALVMFISAIESFLANVDEDQEKADKRKISQKHKQFKKDFPETERYFKYYAETNESTDNSLGEAITLRNIIAHAPQYTDETRAQAAREISTTVLPMLQAIHKSLFGYELTDRLFNRLPELFEISFYLRKNGELKGSEWTRSLAPIAWGIQDFLSVNFVPRYLADYARRSEDEGGFAILDAVDRMYSDERVDCPVCQRNSVGLNFDINAKKQLEISKAQCVNCQLELGNTPLDQLISQAMFDTYFTENEPRIRAEFGLK